MAGYTRSSNFPVSNALQSAKGADACSTPPCEDAFLTVLEPDGQAYAYNTYLGGDQPLTADSAGNTTFYLYGLGAIGEETDAWSYSLPDGTNTPRHLTNLTGTITLSACYTPWGNTLDTYGTGNFAFGYFGGVMDAATGLLYVGNGQYYDPETGRFLTRDAKPNSSNPYVPRDSTGAIIGPLGLRALLFTRRKKGIARSECCSL